MVLIRDLSPTFNSQSQSITTMLSFRTKAYEQKPFYPIDSRQGVIWKPFVLAKAPKDLSVFYLHEVNPLSFFHQ